MYWVISVSRAESLIAALAVSPLRLPIVLVITRYFY